MARTDGVVVRTYAVTYSAGSRIPSHAHDWHQLVFASEGAMQVETPEGTWVVPPARAVWVPAKTAHVIRMVGRVAMRTLYFRARVARALPTRCSVLGVSPLLRALIERTVELGTLARDRPEQARLLGVIVDELRSLEVSPLELPMPRDARAARLVALLDAAPGAQTPLDVLSRRAGASKRTMERIFQVETGRSLGRWRQQHRLMHALRSLSQDHSVTRTAVEAGYESASAFIHAFRRTFGTTPRRYFADATTDR